MKKILLLNSVLMMLLLLTSCCGEIYADQPDVNINPIYEIEVDSEGIDKLTDLIDLSRFPPRYPDEEPSDIVYWGYLNFVNVRFYLAPDERIANDWFTQDCESFVEQPSRIRYGGEGDNRYCIPYITQARNDPEGLCLPLDRYHLYIVFQKGRLIMVIDETRNDRDGGNLTEIIEEVADSFWKGLYGE